MIVLIVILFFPQDYQRKTKKYPIQVGMSLDLEQGSFRIYIPEIVLTNKNGYEFLASIYPRVIGQKQQNILVDFSKCLIFDGNLASALGAVLDAIVSCGYHVYLKSPPPGKAKRVLSRNHFFKAWSVSTNTEERENFVYYHKFSSSETDAFKDYIDKELVHKKLFPVHTDLVGETIIANVYEIYANAIMHGRTNYVYSCGEYKEKEKILEMSIVDFGRTIHTNVNDYLSQKNIGTLNAVDAIEWAFVIGNTTKLIPGGLGLAMLKEFMNLNNGCIQVVSGEGFLEIIGDKVIKTMLSVSFTGTIVTMRFNFNDPKNYFMTSEKQIDINNLL